MKKREKSFSLAKKLITAACIALLFPVLAGAQTLTVQGRVTDDGGDPLPGAVVLVPGEGGTPKATAMADLDGNYSISCDAQGILEFRYIGMKDMQEKVNGRARIDVVMQQDASFVLDEAVAIGYGSVRREDLTGSVSNVGWEKSGIIP